MEGIEWVVVQESGERLQETYKWQCKERLYLVRAMNIQCARVEFNARNIFILENHYIFARER